METCAYSDVYTAYTYIIYCVFLLLCVFVFAFFLGVIYYVHMCVLWLKISSIYAGGLISKKNRWCSSIACFFRIHFSTPLSLSPSLALTQLIIERLINCLVLDDGLIKYIECGSVAFKKYIQHNTIQYNTKSKKNETNEMTFFWLINDLPSTTTTATITTLFRIFLSFSPKDLFDRYIYIRLSFLFLYFLIISPFPSFLLPFYYLLSDRYIISLF